MFVKISINVNLLFTWWHFSFTLDMSIGRAFSIPGNGKDVVYGINARNKYTWGKKLLGYQIILP